MGSMGRINLYVLSATHPPQPQGANYGKLKKRTNDNKYCIRKQDLSLREGLSRTNCKKMFFRKIIKKF